MQYKIIDEQNDIAISIKKLSLLDSDNIFYRLDLNLVVAITSYYEKS